MDDFLHSPAFALVGFGDMPVGSVVAFAGALGPPVPNTASPPSTATAGPHTTDPIEAWGWMFCDGRPLSTGQYPELFATLGYLYGPSADGDSFCIPDYRGNFLRCIDAGANVDPDSAERKAAPGGTVTGVGSQQSFALQAHDHDYLAASTTAAPAQSGDTAGVPLGKSTATVGGPISSPSPATPVQVSQHETRPTNTYVNYIIKFTSALRRRI